MKGLTIVLSAFLVIPAIAQEEMLVEESERDLSDLEAGSFDLNHTDEQTLLQFSALEPQQIRDILAYRDKYGPFISPIELQVIRCLSVNDIRKLLTTFSIQDVSRYAGESNSYILVRYKRSGGADTHYSMLRAQVDISKELRTGFTAEQDFGESIGWNPSATKYIADHTSGYLQWRPDPSWQLVIGNYTLHFGQGLVSGASFSVGKGRNSVLMLAGNKSNLRGYRGLQESQARFGSGIVFTRDIITAGIYYGNTRHDAKVYDEPGTRFIYGFQTSGIHQSDGEKEARKKVTRETAGMFTELTFNRFSLGGIFQADNLSIPIRRRPQVYAAHDWSGNLLITAGTNIRYTYQNMHAWAAIALNNAGKHVYQIGILYSPGKKWYAGILFRNYDAGYLSFDAKAFGERSAGPENERGLYFGLAWKPKKRWEINAFYDIYLFPWVSYSVSGPSTGSEYFISGLLRLKNGIELRTDFRSEQKHDNLSNENAFITGYDSRITRQAGLYLSVNLNRVVTYRIRGRWKNIAGTNANQSGLAAYNEIILSLGKWTASYRLCLFDTDGFDSRIYFYERDLWGSFSLPSFQDSGWSQYFLVRYAVSSRIDAWFRISGSGKVNIASPGVITGKKLVSCQVRIKI